MISVIIPTFNRSGFLQKAVKSVLGKKTIIAGGSSIGIITNETLIYEGASVAIMVIAADELHFKTDITPGLIEGEELCGTKAGRRMKQLLQTENPNLILFYDSLRPKKEDGVKFIGATPILKGIGSEIGDWPPTAGVGLVTLSWTNCKLWNEEQISSGSIMSLIISGTSSVSLSTRVISRARDNWLPESILLTNSSIVLFSFISLRSKFNRKRSIYASYRLSFSDYRPIKRGFLFSINALRPSFRSSLFIA